MYNPCIAEVAYCVTNAAVNPMEPWGSIAEFFPVETDATQALGVQSCRRTCGIYADSTPGNANPTMLSMTLGPAPWAGPA